MLADFYGCAKKEEIARVATAAAGAGCLLIRSCVERLREKWSAPAPVAAATTPVADI